MNYSAIQLQFFERLGRPFAAEEIFDQIPDTVFFIKDRLGRYIAVNKTLVERCGQEDKSGLLGFNAHDVFPRPLGESYTLQDMEVVKKGRSIHGQLELHLYANGRQGWCLTWKEPVLAASGEIVGVSGISRDVRSSSEVERDLEAVSGVLRYIRENLEEPLRLGELAKSAGLSIYQLDQRIRTLFDVSAGQYVTRCRIDTACHLLERTDEAISQIALACGYGDQSAFTRQFRHTVGLPPKAYRERIG